MKKVEGTIVEMVFGSHLYGLDTPLSDKDYIGIYQPTLDEILLKTDENVIEMNTGNSVDKNTPGDIDRKFYSLWKFIQGCKKGDTNVLDMLHAPEDKIITTTPVWEELTKHKSKTYSKNMSGMLGYIRSQANRYGVRGTRLACIGKVLKMCKQVRNKKSELTEFWTFLPLGEHIEIKVTQDEVHGQQIFYTVCGKKFLNNTSFEKVEESMSALAKKYGHRSKLAEENCGTDFKAISHAFRVGYQMRSIYKTGNYTFPLDESEYIIDVKNGDVNPQEASKKLENLVVEVEKLSEQSTFQENTDKQFWDKLYLSLTRRMFFETI